MQQQVQQLEAAVASAQPHLPHPVLVRGTSHSARTSAPVTLSDSSAAGRMSSDSLTTLSPRSHAGDAPGPAGAGAGPGALRAGSEADAEVEHLSVKRAKENLARAGAIQGESLSGGAGLTPPVRTQSDAGRLLARERASAVASSLAGAGPSPALLNVQPDSQSQAASPEEEASIATSAMVLGEAPEEMPHSRGSIDLGSLQGGARSGRPSLDKAAHGQVHGQGESRQEVATAQQHGALLDLLGEEVSIPPAAAGLAVLAGHVHVADAEIQTQPVSGSSAEVQTDAAAATGVAASTQAGPVEGSTAAVQTDAPEAGVAAGMQTDAPAQGVAEAVQTDALATGVTAGIQTEGVVGAAVLVQTDALAGGVAAEIQTDSVQGAAAAVQTEVALCLAAEMQTDSVQGAAASVQTEAAEAGVAAAMQTDAPAENVAGSSQTDTPAPSVASAMQTDDLLFGYGRVEGSGVAAEMQTDAAEPGVTAGMQTDLLWGLAAEVQTDGSPEGVAASSQTDVAQAGASAVAEAQTELSGNVAPAADSDAAKGVAAAESAVTGDLLDGEGRGSWAEGEIDGGDETSRGWGEGDLQQQQEAEGVDDGDEVTAAMKAMVEAAELPTPQLQKGDGHAPLDVEGEGEAMREPWTAPSSQGEADEHHSHLGQANASVASHFMAPPPHTPEANAGFAGAAVGDGFGAAGKVLGQHEADAGDRARVAELTGQVQELLGKLSLYEATLEHLRSTVEEADAKKELLQEQNLELAAR